MGGPGIVKDESAEANPQALLKADHRRARCGEAKSWGPGLPAWLHEYSSGTDGGNSVLRISAQKPGMGRRQEQLSSQLDVLHYEEFGFLVLVRS